MLVRPHEECRCQGRRSLSFPSEKAVVRGACGCGLRDGRKQPRGQRGLSLLRCPSVDETTTDVLAVKHVTSVRSYNVKALMRVKCYKAVRHFPPRLGHAAR